MCQHQTCILISKVVFFSSGSLGRMPFISLFHEPAKKLIKNHIWKLKQILWYLWSISAMLYLVFSPFGYNLSPLSQITSRKFTATLSGTSQPISHLEPHCFLLSESIPIQKFHRLHLYTQCEALYKPCNIWSARKPCFILQVGSVINCSVWSPDLDRVPCISKKIHRQ